MAFPIRATEATRNGKAVNLSAREFQLLRYFVEHPARTLTREELLKEVWGYNANLFISTCGCARGQFASETRE